MSDRVVMLLAIFAPMLAGFVTLLLPARAALLRTAVGASGPLFAFVSLLGLLGDAEHSGSVGWGYIPDLGIEFFFRSDRLALFFALLVSGIGSLIVPYAHAYFRGDAAKIGRLLPMLGLFATAMLGVALSDSMLGLFVFWELTTISSFLLIGWERTNPGAVRSALQAASITGLGGLALLVGVTIFGVTGGVWRFSELGDASMPGWAMTAGVALIGVAAATKSAQFPLHGWLPGAMAAPTPVSAYLHSATMVKAGVFLLARVVVDLEGVELWPLLFVPLGALTMAYAAVQALRGATVKRVLAFSTVSQLGLFVCLYGLGGLHPSDPSHHTLEWPIGQILNHAAYKAPLFMLAGTMAIHAGVANIAQLRGLARRMPVVGWLFIVGLYAMAAGPGTFSFAAKEFFVVGAYQATEASHHAWLGWLAIVAVAIAAACNAALLVRIGRLVFGSVEEGSVEVKPGSGWMWWPAALLLLLQVVGGIAPGALEGALLSVETNPLEHLYSTFDLFGKPGLPLFVSLGALAAGVVLGLSPLLRKPGGEPCDHLFGSLHRLLELVAFAVVSTFQTGSIRRYLFLSIATLGAGLLIVMTRDERWLTVPEFTGLIDSHEPAIVIFAILAAIFVCVSALALPPCRLRIVRVLVLGAVGFGVTMLYLINRAPDLALTQIMFEIISVIMFLLVMRMLPERTRADQDRVDLPRAAFAGVIGVLVGWAVFHAGAVPDTEVRPTGSAERLGAWFLDHAHEGSALTGGRNGQGDNVVNVILVDFRGYDTMGEIAVLGIAMLAVLAMLGPRRLRPALRSEQVRVPGVQYGPQRTLVSSMLRVGMRVIVPLALIFAGYVFFKGHQSPGGGFIAGLVASVALIVYRMTEGRVALRSLIPLNPALLVAAGLAIALVTGAVPLVLDLIGGEALPFLTSGDDKLYLNRDHSEYFHLTSVMFFDLGVFIVVVGASVGMINRLEEELE